MQLEPAQIEIDTEKKFKTSKLPVEEGEVKKYLEGFTDESGRKIDGYAPEELGTGPNKILITDSAGLKSIRDTYGEAFTHGGIKLYGHTPNLKPDSRSEAETKGYYLEHVLPHEIGHIRMEHTKPGNKWESISKSSASGSHEIDADIFAHDYRERRNLNNVGDKNMGVHGTYINKNPVVRDALEDMDRQEFERFLKKRKLGKVDGAGEFIETEYQQELPRYE